MVVLVDLGVVTLEPGLQPRELVLAYSDVSRGRIVSDRGPAFDESHPGHMRHAAHTWFAIPLAEATVPGARYVIEVQGFSQVSVWVTSSDLGPSRYAVEVLRGGYRTRCILPPLPAAVPGAQPFTPPAVLPRFERDEVL
jgi:hypothetical protein